MSRGIGTTNESSVNAAHVHEVTLVKLEFDTPVYVHSGVGSISYDGNTYLGVGSLGTIAPLRESEVLGPSQITLSIDGTNSSYVTEVFDAGNYGDIVTIYQGYRQDDGTLVADPWIAWKGSYEYGSLDDGESSVASITCQHDLSILSEKHGDRYSHEDQTDKFAGDLGLEFAASTIGHKILWGGQGVDSRGGFGRDQPVIRYDER